MTDNGRGMPVDIHPHAGRIRRGGGLHRSCTRAASLITMNYAYSGGLHGVGASRRKRPERMGDRRCVYATISTIAQKFSSVYDEKQEEDRLRPSPNGPLEKLGATRKRGTRGALPARQARVRRRRASTRDTVARRMRELAYLNKGIHFRLCTTQRVEPARDARPTRYTALKAGLSDFVQYLNADGTPLT